MYEPPRDATDRDAPMVCDKFTQSNAVHEVIVHRKDGVRSPAPIRYHGLWVCIVVTGSQCTPDRIMALRLVCKQFQLLRYLYGIGVWHLLLVVG